MMKRLRRWTFLMLIVALGCFALAQTACNTMEGAGQDIEDAGEAIQDAAD